MFFAKFVSKIMGPVVDQPESSPELVHYLLNDKGVIQYNLN